jgi:uncharacterized protein YqgQ
LPKKEKKQKNRENTFLEFQQKVESREKNEANMLKYFLWILLFSFPAYSCEECLREIHELFEYNYRLCEKYKNCTESYWYRCGQEHALFKAKNILKKYHPEVFENQTYFLDSG